MDGKFVPRYEKIKFVIWDGISSKTFATDSSSGEAATTTAAALFTAVSAEATAAMTVTAMSKASSTASSSTTITDSGQQGSGGLSTGAKIGIGVGVLFGVFAIAGGILAAYFLGRKKRSTPTANVSHVQQQFTAQEPQPPPTPFAAVPVAAEKFLHQPVVTEIYPPRPQPPTSAVSAVSPATLLDTTPPPLVYAQPQQSTIALPQFSQVYEAPGVPSQYIPPSFSPQGLPPHTVHEAPTHAPGVAGCIELPASQS